MTKDNPFLTFRFSAVFQQNWFYWIRQYGKSNGKKFNEKGVYKFCLRGIVSFSPVSTIKFFENSSIFHSYQTSFFSFHTISFSRATKLLFMTSRKTVSQTWPRLEQLDVVVQLKLLKMPTQLLLCFLPANMSSTPILERVAFLSKPFECGLKLLFDLKTALYLGIYQILLHCQRWS